MSLSTRHWGRQYFTWTLICLQLPIYGIVWWLSSAFDFHTAVVDRPILTVLGLLIVNTGLQLWSLWRLLQAEDSKRLAWKIISVAVAMRCTLIASTPIQEVDIYRYMWDGIVSSQGISPFRYPPLIIADNNLPPADENVASLRLLTSKYPGMRETLCRVHYPELPTVYPPSSQFVFLVAALLTPETADVGLRVLVMKLFIVAFDIAALFCLWGLLQAFKMHSAWLIAYGWSPLIIKEFANSGHLDSIAVFCTAAATYLLVATSSRRGLCVSGLLAGLAVAAKLYPAILFPLWFLYAWRQKGISQALLFLTLGVLFSGFLMAPMLSGRVSSIVTPVEAPASSSIEALQAAQAGQDFGAAGSSNSLTGLSTFLTRWEMNALLFMIIEENLRPDGHVPEQPPLWFTVVPNSWRTGWLEWLARLSRLDPERLPFIAARVITLLGFGLLTVWLMISVWTNPARLPETLFLSLAWFWFLAPTQNPWYWSWALIFIPFANSRVWLAVSGLVLLYYLRFWFTYQACEINFLQTGYTGTAFFDFVIVWLEFGPFLGVLAITTIYRGIQKRDYERDFPKKLGH